MYLSATVKRFVRNSSVYTDESDGYIIDRNVVGKSSVYTDEFPTNVTVIYLIGMSSELRRYIPTHTLWSESCRYIQTNFRRSNIFCFRRKVVKCVRRLCCPSERPSKYSVFSCSVLVNYII